MTVVIVKKNSQVKLLGHNKLVFNYLDAVCSLIDLWPWKHVCVGKLLWDSSTGTEKKCGERLDNLTGRALTFWDPVILAMLSG